MQVLLGNVAAAGDKLGDYYRYFTWPFYSSLYVSRKIRNGSISIGMGYGPNGWGSIPGRGKIFLFSIVSRPALGFTQPPI
jgi:hypothetical protein